MKEVTRPRSLHHHVRCQGLMLSCHSAVLRSAQAAVCQGSDCSSRRRLSIKTSPLLSDRLCYIMASSSQLRMLSACMRTLAHDATSGAPCCRKRSGRAAALDPPLPAPASNSMVQCREKAKGSKHKHGQAGSAAGVCNVTGSVGTCCDIFMAFINDRYSDHSARASAAVVQVFAPNVQVSAGARHG